MKTSNRQYAKRQTSWIRNKLLPAVRASKAAEEGKSAEVYLLDATGLHYPSFPKLEDQRLIVEFISTEPEEWSSVVRDLAVSLTEGRENTLFLSIGDTDFYAHSWNSLPQMRTIT